MGSSFVGSLPSDPGTSVLVGMLYGFLVKGEPGLACVREGQTIMSRIDNFTFSFIKNKTVSYSLEIVIRKNRKWFFSLQENDPRMMTPSGQSTTTVPGKTTIGTGMTTTTAGPVDPCPPRLCFERQGTLGDGICDRELNNEDCDYDGGRPADDPDIVN